MSPDTNREKCIICNEEVEETDKILIFEKAIKTLIKASKEIGDKKYQKMEGLQFFNVHRNCKIM